MLSLIIKCELTYALPNIFISFILKKFCFTAHNSSESNSSSNSNSKPSTNCIDSPPAINSSESNSNHSDTSTSTSNNLFAAAILDQITGSAFTQQQQQQQNFSTPSSISLNSSVHYSTTPSSCVDSVIKPPTSVSVAATSTVTCSSSASGALYSAAAATGSAVTRSNSVQPQISPSSSSCNVIGSNVTQPSINVLMMNGPVSPKISSQIYNLPSLSGVVRIFSY